MKATVIFILACATSVLGAHKQKRAAYDLPDALELLHEPLKYTFVCERDGYFADQDNNCQIFHVCHTVAQAYGGTKILHYSFICGNLTIFNQRSLTCTYPKDAVPCERAHEYYHLNDAIGNPDAVFHSDGQGGHGGFGAGQRGGPGSGGSGGRGRDRGTGTLDPRQRENLEKERILRELNRKFNELVEEGKNLDDEYAEIDRRSQRN